MNPVRAISLSALSAASLMTLAGGSVQAQCLDVYRTMLPDFDQRRMAGPDVLGLPANGSAHCVPASWADNIAYMSNHGLPGFTLYTQYDWKSPATYNFAGALIYVLGSDMGTDGGTGWDDAIHGLKVITNQREPGKVVYGYKNYSELDVPCPKDMRELLLCGGFGGVSRGFYSPVDGEADGRLERTGGHMHALRGVHNICNTTPTISTRDPATSASLDSQFDQSPFLTCYQRAEKQTFLFSVDGQPHSRTLWYWPDSSTASTVKVFDGFECAVPTVAVSGKPTVGNEPSGIDIARGFELTEGIHPTHTGPLMPPGTGQIRGLHIDPCLAWAWVMADGPNNTTRVIRVGLGSGDTEMKYELENALISSIVTHSGQPLLATSTHLTKLSRNADDQVVQLQQARQTSLIQKMAEDDTTGELVLIKGSPSAPTICRRSLDLVQPEGPTNPCPPGVVFNGPIGLAINPSDGMMLCCSTGSNHLFLLQRDAAGGTALYQDIVIPAGSMPASPCWSDTGSILFTSDGIVQELEQPAGGGPWQPKANSFYAGRPVASGQPFALAATRRASEIHTDGDLRSISPEGLPGVPDDCSADFNGDGDVGTDADIEAFFACLAGNCCTTCLASGADFNSDGDVGTDADIEAFFRVLAGGAC